MSPWQRPLLIATRGRYRGNLETDDGIALAPRPACQVTARCTRGTFFTFGHESLLPPKLPLQAAAAASACGIAPTLRFLWHRGRGQFTASATQIEQCCTAHTVRPPRSRGLADKQLSRRKRRSPAFSRARTWGGGRGRPQPLQPVGLAQNLHANCGLHSRDWSAARRRCSSPPNPKRPATDTASPL